MRVVHSLLVQNDQILLLFKPSRQKWFLPGGKAEFGEHIIQTGLREFYEETGLQLKHTRVGAITTVVVGEGLEKKEWMLYTIKGTDSVGELIKENREGSLMWHSIQKIDELPMFAGDRFIIKSLLHSDHLVVSTQIYTPKYDLIKIIQVTDE